MGSQTVRVVTILGLAFAICAAPALSAPDPDKAIINKCLKAADFEGCYRTLSGQGSATAKDTAMNQEYVDTDIQKTRSSEKEQYSYQVLLDTSKVCNLALYETFLDICGTPIAKVNIREWVRSHVQTSCNIFGWCPGEKFNYALAFQTKNGPAAIVFTILHRPTATAFDKVFTSWSGKISRRVEGDKFIAPW